MSGTPEKGKKVPSTFKPGLKRVKSDPKNNLSKLDRHSVKYSHSFQGKPRVRPPRPHLSDNLKKKFHKHIEKVRKVKEKKKFLLHEFIKFVEFFVLKKFFSTETQYLTDLNAVFDTFCVRIKRGGILKSKMNLFGEFEVIIPINEKFLGDLKKNQILDTEKSDIKRFCEVINRNAPSFRLYISYIQKYNRILQFLMDEKKKNEKLRKLFEECENDYKKRNMRIKSVISYLILPVQRIPRYVTILECLFTEIKENENLKLLNRNEMKKLEFAQKIIADIAKYCDTKVKYNTSRQVELERLKELSFLLKIIDLIQPHRKLIHQITDDGVVQGTVKKSFKKKDVYLYLFTDLVVVYWRKKKKSVPVILNSKVLVKEVKIMETIINKNFRHRISIRKTDDLKFSLFLDFKEKKDCDDWQIHLKKQVEVTKFISGSVDQVRLGKFDSKTKQFFRRTISLGSLDIPSLSSTTDKDFRKSVMYHKDKFNTPEK